MAESLRIELCVAGGDLIEELALIAAPPLVGENFDLAVAGEAGGIDPVADFAEVDAAFAHQAAVVEEIGGRRFPIADMEGVQAAGLASEINLRLQLRVPPDVIHIHGDADGLWRAEDVADFMRLAHRVHRAAVIGIHRMQRLNGEFHTRRLRRRQTSRDAFRDLLAGFDQTLPRNGSADQNDEWSADGVRLLNGSPIIVDGFLAVRSRLGREKAPAAQTDHVQAGIGCLTLHRIQIAAFESLTPDGDAAHAALGKLGKALIEAQRLRGDGVDAQSAHSSIMAAPTHKKKMILRCTGLEILINDHGTLPTRLLH